MLQIIIVVWLSAAVMRMSPGVALLLFLLYSALTGLANGLISLIAARVLLGAGQSVAFPASARAVANWFPPNERGGATGVYLSGVRTGQAAINWAGGSLIAVFGWRAFFWWAGLAGIVWLISWLAFHWRHERIPLTPAVAVSKPTVPALELLRDRRMLGIFLGFFAYDYVWLLLATWLPGYLILERKFTPQQMAIYVALPYAASAVVIVATGVFSDFVVRRGYGEIAVRKWFVAAGMLAAGAVIGPAGFVEDPRLCAWLLAAGICGLSVASPSTWALTQAVCGRERAGLGAGIQNLGGNLGGSVAPALTGLLAHLTGSFAPGLALAGIVLSAGVGVYWRLIPSDTPSVTSRR
jgi:MFS family permease